MIGRNLAYNFGWTILGKQLSDIHTTICSFRRVVSTMTIHATAATESYSSSVDKQPLLRADEIPKKGALQEGVAPQVSFYRRKLPTS